MSRRDDVVPRDDAALERHEAARVQRNAGQSHLQLAGVIRNAVYVEVARIERGRVTLVVRIGDGETHEVELKRGQGWMADLYVKSESP